MGEIAKRMKNKWMKWSERGAENLGNLLMKMRCEKDVYESFIEHDQNLALLGLIEIEDEIVTVEGDKEVIRRTYKLTPKRCRDSRKSI